GFPPRARAGPALRARDRARGEEPGGRLGHRRARPAETAVDPRRPCEAEMRDDPPLLNVSDLVVSFGGDGRELRVQAVNGVTFPLAAGESLGFVGESGSRQSVTALSLMGLLRGGRVSGGIPL